MIEAFFTVFPALQAIFRLGFEPKESYFRELLPEEYAHIAKDGKDISEKWYQVVPDKKEYPLASKFICNEEQRDSLLLAAQMVHNMCENSEKYKNTSFEDKLNYVAHVLPDVFTANTGYPHTPIEK